VEYRWYAIQTTAGHENKVRSLLGMRIKDDPRPEGQKLVAQALVPTQEVVEIKNGKKVTVERKLYPGYVIVQMGMSQEAQHVVNSIQGVIKFVGTSKAPMPLREDEVNRLLGIMEPEAEAAAPKEEIPFLPGQAVEITVLGLQRRGRGSVGRQGQGEGVGVVVRSTHHGGARLLATPRALAARTPRPPGCTGGRHGHSGHSVIRLRALPARVVKGETWRKRSRPW
jgi:transcriptional antiterminator NusG